MAYDYLRNPQAIEDRSFEMIRACTDLRGFDPQQAQVAMRVVHTCGLPDVTQHLRFTGNAVPAGCAALAAGNVVLCDVEMIVRGISQRFIDNPVQCYLNADDIAQKVTHSGQTRSMAALDYWQSQLGGAIAVIGNAPTALFRLLEILHAGAAKPALVVAVPVGFVGAAESKQALWETCETLGLEAITLLGRQGGSAIASAVINALGRMNKGVFF